MKTPFLEESIEPYLRIVAEVEAELQRVLNSRVELVEAVNRHTLDAGGKRLRPAFVVLSAEATGMPFDRERAIRLAACMELIHMATLIHDDVIDETTHRRGKATAATVFGNTASILSGDVCLAKAMVLLAADGDLNIIRLVAGAVERMAEGEVREIETRGNFDLARECHFDILGMKTADFIACCCEVGAMIPAASEQSQNALRRYGFEVGMAFQLIDDILDYAGDPESTGKPIGTDFCEGCATLPLIVLRERIPADGIEFARRKFGNGVMEAELKQLVDLMHDHRSFAEARSEASAAIHRAINNLSVLPETTSRHLLIAAADRIVTREA